MVPPFVCTRSFLSIVPWDDIQAISSFLAPLLGTPNHYQDSKASKHPPPHIEKGQLDLNCSPTSEEEMTSSKPWPPQFKARDYVFGKVDNCKHGHKSVHLGGSFECRGFLPPSSIPPAPQC